jgi:hypothetical protein
MFTSNGELLYNVKRHDPDDIYWCFNFEQNVLNYLQIKTNNRDNEIKHSMYHARLGFTTLHK